jgi:hypothetical protein
MKLLSTFSLVPRETLLQKKLETTGNEIEEFRNELAESKF